MNPDPTHHDPEREGFIHWCTSQARKLQELGDQEGALAIVRQGLEKYPGEARLAELAASLDPGASREANARAADIALLKRFIEKGELVREEKTASRVQMSLEEIDRRHPDDQEIQLLILQVRAFFATTAAKHPPAAAPPPPPPPPPPAAAPPAPEPAPFDFGAAAPPSAPAASPFDFTAQQPAAPPPPPAAAPPPPPPPPAPAAAAKAAPPPKPPAPPKPAGGKKQPVLLYGVIAAAVVAVVLGGVYLVRQLAPKPVALVPVEFRTTPPGATIRVGGENRGASNLTLNLAPGEYQAEAQLEGYQPAATRFLVEAGKPLTVELALSAWRPVFRFFTDVEDGSATLGGRALTAAGAGEAILEGLDDGEYELKYASRAGEATAKVAFSGSAMPALAAAAKAKNLILVLVHQQGSRAAVYSSLANARVGLDGASPEPLPAEGRTFTDLAPGAHQLAFDDGKAPRTIPLQTGGAPSVSAYLFAPPAADKGTLLVVAGVDGAQVFVNNRRHWQVTRNGQIRIANLGPGSYQVRVAREGYENSESRRVEIKANEEARAEFQLKPIVRMATLRLSGPAGAEVIVDGSPIGTIGDDGSFSAPISPGSHSIELRRGAARSRAVTHNFTAGATWQPAAGEIALVQPDGTVRFELSPAGTQLMLRRQGEPESAGRRVTGSSMTLPEGSYIVVGSAPGHTPSQVLFAVQPGATVNVAVRLAAAAEPAKPKAAVYGMAEFDDPNEWDNQQGWFVRRGGNYATFSRTPTGGVFTFTIQLRRGKRLQWFLNFTDEKNHLLFRMDRKQFFRLSVAGGRTMELAKTDHGAEGANTFEVRITVNGASVTHEIRRGGQWVKIDEYQHPAPVEAGKFGFYIPGGKFLTGSDEYALKDFQFTARAR